MPDWRSEVRARLSSVRLSPAREAEIVEELSQHLDDRWRELVAEGKTPDAARHLALGELGHGSLGPLFGSSAPVALGGPHASGREPAVLVGGPHGRFATGRAGTPCRTPIEYPLQKIRDEVGRGWLQDFLNANVVLFQDPFIPRHDFFDRHGHCLEPVIR